ncbi:MAG: prepilin-type N-terminal cleavage/methylation domain-containing protein [Candidatus Pacebacteria bacterium]|nr:prepilin-type N-terminal cleavage/methylation domain-containing protein [Candidatus Paceibacterota bacterium]
MSKKQIAFTLIELLVVIAIIGILSGLIVITMNGMVNSANDAKRKDGIDALRKALVAYGAINNYSYPVQATTCTIGDPSGINKCPASFATALADYISVLPVDPVSGYYTYYSPTGSDFTVSVVLSDSKMYSYNSTNRYSSSIIARSTSSPLYNKVNSIPLDQATTVNIDDSVNGALSGYAVKFSNGWTARSIMNNAHGFSSGTYDIYARIRSDGTGNYPTSLSSSGVYDSTTSSTLLTGNYVGNITTSYKTFYIGRVAINGTDSTSVYFSSSGVTTNYYLDYTEFRIVQ